MSSGMDIDRLSGFSRGVGHQLGGPDRTAAVSAELLGQADDDALRSTQEAEPVETLVLRDLADELGTVPAQAGDDVVDVVDGEHDAAHAQRSSPGRFPARL